MKSRSSFHVILQDPIDPAFIKMLTIKGYYIIRIGGTWEEGVSQKLTQNVRGGAVQGGIKFEISWEPTFPVHNKTQVESVQLGMTLDMGDHP